MRTSIHIAAGLFLLVITIVFFFIFSTGDVDREEQVNTLPYANFSKVNNKFKGVELHNEKKAFKGYNLYNPRNRSKGFLIDMKGRVLHQWQTDTSIAGWHVTRLMPGGTLLTVKKDEELRAINLDSKTLWVKNIRAHHDVIYDTGSQKIYLLGREDREVPFGKDSAPVLDDTVLVLNKKGVQSRKVSVYDLVEKWVTDKMLKNSKNWYSSPGVIEQVAKQREQVGYKYEGSTPADIFHTNSIDLVTEDVPGCCKKRNVILSIRNLNLVVIADLESKEVVWSWGPGEISRQHHATYIGKNRILLFDNGVKNAESRVLIVDLPTKKITWKYDKDFYTQLGGSSQYLPNGNVLIGQSGQGRAFEVTAEGEIVWDFYNPEFTDATNERAFLYRIERITDASFAPLIKKLVRSSRAKTTKE